MLLGFLTVALLFSIVSGGDKLPNVAVLGSNDHFGQKFCRYVAAVTSYCSLIPSHQFDNNESFDSIILLDMDFSCSGNTKSNSDKVNLLIANMKPFQQLIFLVPVGDSTLEESSLFVEEMEIHLKRSGAASAPHVVGIRVGSVLGDNLSNSLSDNSANNLLLHLISGAYVDGYIPLYSSVRYPHTVHRMAWSTDLIQLFATIIVENQIGQPTRPKTPFTFLDFESFKLSYYSLLNTIAAKTGAPIHHSSVSALDNLSLFSQLSSDTDITTTVCTGSCGFLSHFASQGSLDVVVEEVIENIPDRFTDVTPIGWRVSDHIHAVSRTDMSIFEWIAAEVDNSNIQQPYKSVVEISFTQGSLLLGAFAAKGWTVHGIYPYLSSAYDAASSKTFPFSDYNGQIPSEVDVIIVNGAPKKEDVSALLHACRRWLRSWHHLYIILPLDVSRLPWMQKQFHSTIVHALPSSYCILSTPLASAYAGVAPLLDSFEEFMLATSMITNESQWRKRLQVGAVRNMRQWINTQLNALSTDGFEVAGFHAEASPQDWLFMDYLLSYDQRRYEFSFVMSDNKVLTSKVAYCPNSRTGFRVPLLSVSSLATRTSTASPLVIVVFPWEQWNSIVTRVQLTMKNTIGIEQVLMVQPYPQQRVVVVRIPKKEVYDGVPAPPGTLLQSTHHPPTWPGFPVTVSTRTPPKPTPLIYLVSHMKNEAVLLPQWIRHHAHMFDGAIIIDYHSQDDSVGIIQREAPSSWKVITTYTDYYSAKLLDDEVIDYENRFPEGSWKISITLTEFIVHADFRNEVAKAEGANKTILRLPGYYMVGDDRVPYNDQDSIVRQRSVYFTTPGKPEGQEWMGLSMCGRYMHRVHGGIGYGVGRHFPVFRHRGVEFVLNGGHSFNSFGLQFGWLRGGMIVKYNWTPWPHVLARKLNIGSGQSNSDRLNEMGIQHRTSQQDQNAKKELLAQAGTDMRDVFQSKIHRFWLEAFFMESPYYSSTDTFITSLDHFEIGYSSSKIFHISYFDIIYYDFQAPELYYIRQYCEAHNPLHMMDECVKMAVLGIEENFPSTFDAVSFSILNHTSGEEVTIITGADKTIAT